MHETLVPIRFLTVERRDSGDVESSFAAGANAVLPTL